MDWNYVAGFFDGEGHVIAKRYWHNTKKRYYRKTTVGLTQAEERKHVLFKIKEFLEKEGFHPSLRKERDYRDKRGYKLQSKWRLEIQNTEEAINLLKHLKDRVVAKKEPVAKAIEFLEELGTYRARKHFTAEQIKEMKDLYSKDYSTVAIGKKFNCNCNTINKVLKGAGVKIRSPSAWTKLARKKVSESMKKTRRKRKKGAGNELP